MIKIDMHIHTKYSKDSSIEIEDLIEIARKIGLNGVAITDHDTLKGYKVAKKYINEDFIIIPGIEWKTDRGEILGYFIQEEPKSRDLYEVIDEIKEQGGMIGVPHPFDIFRRSINKHIYEIIDKIDFIEVINGRCSSSIFNEKALKISREYGIPGIAGSDAHRIEEIGLAYIEINDLRDLRKRKIINIGGRILSKRDIFIDFLRYIASKL